MKEVHEYLHRAEECERRATKAANEFQKKTFLDLAHGWRKLAEERQRNIELIHMGEKSRAKRS